MKSLYYNVNPIGWATTLWLKRFWKGAMFSRLNGVSLREVPKPELPGANWVICKTLLGGICGTDIGIITQKQPPDSILQEFSSMPMRLGHENIAIVDQVGSGVDKSWIGKRVIADPTLCCEVRGIEPVCAPCQRGEFGACENFGAKPESGSSKMGPGTSIGYCGEFGGSFSEYFPAHISSLTEVPEKISDEQAILTDPLACSLHSVLRADLSKCKTALVYGAGVLGLGVIACLRAVGFTGEIHTLNRGRTAEPLAMQFGADKFIVPHKSKANRYKQIADQTDATLHRARFGNYMLSGGYDLVFDCVGAPAVFEDCLKFAAARGQAVMVATANKGNIDMTPLWFRELKIIGVFGRQIENYEGEFIHTNSLVHKFMLEGKLNVGKMLTHTFPIQEYKKALNSAVFKSASRSIKVAFDFR